MGARSYLAPITTAVGMAIIIQVHKSAAAIEFLAKAPGLPAAERKIIIQQAQFVVMATSCQGRLVINVVAL